MLKAVFEILSARAFLIGIKKNRFFDLFFWGCHSLYFLFCNHLSVCLPTAHLVTIGWILRWTPYAKNDPLSQLMRLQINTFAFFKGSTEGAGNTLKLIYEAGQIVTQNIRAVGFTRDQA